MSRLNTNTNHQLIPRNPTYMMHNKMVTIHSEDRDIVHWPNVSEFEVNLPETLTNIQSVKLVEISMPAVCNIASHLHNNILIFKPGVVLFIPDGLYTPYDLALAFSDPTNYHGSPPSFTVEYDEITNKFTFTDLANIDFTEEFLKETLQALEQDVQYIKFINKKLGISHQPCDQLNFNYERAIDWGLGAILGFSKDKHIAINDKITSNYFSTLATPSTIYMELDKFNSMDELKPYSQRTNNLYNNDFNGTVNSAFAKIPIVPIALTKTTPPTVKNNDIYSSDSVHFGKQFSQNFTFTEENIIQNTSLIMNPPVERVSKIKVKFRHHDGTPIHIKNLNLNFTLAFAQFNNEILRDTHNQMPAAYIMR